MAMFGMDIAQVRTLATSLNTKAGEIDTIVNRVTSELQSTQWKGPDAENFRSDWNGALTKQLRNVAQQLRDASQRATRNANEQEQASGH